MKNMYNHNHVFTPIFATLKHVNSIVAYVLPNTHFIPIRLLRYVLRFTIFFEKTKALALLISRSLLLGEFHNSSKDATVDTLSSRPHRCFFST